MLLEPDGSPAWRSEDVLRVLPEGLAEHTRGETHGLALELAIEPARDGRGGGRRSCAACGRGWPRRSRGARPARRGRGHAPARPLRGGRGLPGSPLPVPAPVAARARSARADLRPARARGCSGSGARRPRVTTVCAPMCRSCWPWRPTRRSPAGATRGSPPRAPRSSRPSRAPASRARWVHLRRVRRVDRRTHALRRDPRAHVHLVGRPAAAEARNAGGTRHGRPDAHPGHGGPGGFGPVPGALRGPERARRAGARARSPEVLDENRFLAARDGIDAQLIDPHRDRSVPASGHLATLVDACWTHARTLRCERELGLLAHLAGDPGAAPPAGDRVGAGGVARVAPHAAGRSSRLLGRSWRSPRSRRGVGPLSTRRSVGRPGWRPDRLPARRGVLLHTPGLLDSPPYGARPSVAEPSRPGLDNPVGTPDTFSDASREPRQSNRCDTGGRRKGGRRAPLAAGATTRAPARRSGHVRRGLRRPWGWLRRLPDRAREAVERRDDCPSAPGRTPLEGLSPVGDDVSMAAPRRDVRRRGGPPSPACTASRSTFPTAGQVVQRVRRRLHERQPHTSRPFRSGRRPRPHPAAGRPRPPTTAARRWSG